MNTPVLSPNHVSPDSLLTTPKIDTPSQIQTPVVHEKWQAPSHGTPMSIANQRAAPADIPVWNRFSALQQPSPSHLGSSNTQLIDTPTSTDLATSSYNNNKSNKMAKNNVRPSVVVDQVPERNIPPVARKSKTVAGHSSLSKAH